MVSLSPPSEDNVPDAKDVKEKFQGSLVAHWASPSRTSWLLRLLTPGGPALVCPPLAVPAHPQGHAAHGAAQHALAGLRGRPALAYQQTSAFAQQPRTRPGVRVSCAIIFLASIFQFAIWTRGPAGGRRCSPRRASGPRARVHVCQAAPVPLRPACWPFACTCVLSSFSTAIFHAMQIAVPFAFLLLRLLVRLAKASLRALRACGACARGPGAGGPRTEGPVPHPPCPC